MLTLPFRIAATIAIALFCYSRLVRRAVAGLAVSTAIVAAQHGELLQAAAAGSAEGAPLGTAFRALLLLVAG
ncbi:hypothetical protein [Aestuariivirga sp.]|uniref:hypothetical protein n=1 Tax=Aestuariivirga sp. TaxID=2650926 RepID=UPI00391B6039